MANFIRFSFVVFLVLLQLVAPLIHAHKNEKFSVASSFHLPEFEQVNALLDNATMTAPSFHEGEMVTISAGVKENQRRFSSDDTLHIFIALAFVLLFAALQEMLRPFVVQTEPIKRRRYFNLASLRAPPIFSV